MLEIFLGMMLIFFVIAVIISLYFAVIAFGVVLVPIVLAIAFISIILIILIGAIRGIVLTIFEVTGITWLYNKIKRKLNSQKIRKKL